MGSRLLRIVISAAVVFVTYSAYVWCAVPWIEPAAASVDRPSTPIPDRASRQTIPPDDSMLAWFGHQPGAWELDSPKRLQNDQGILLLQEYTNLGNGKLKIKPCTIVFMSNDEAKPREQRIREAIILQAPDGAILKFDQEIDLRRGDVGKVESGLLLGKVTIRSDQKLPGPADDLAISTFDVAMTTEAITTPHTVQFRWGANHGSGRGMQIDLLDEKTAKKHDVEKKIGRVKLLTLSHDVQMNFQFKGHAGPTDIAAAAASEPPPGATPTETKLAAASDRPATPVTVTCRGPFRYDFPQHQATFQEQVDVLRINAPGPSDRLACELLELHLAPEVAEEGSPPKAESGFPKLEAKRLIARGNPVVLSAPSSAVYARGELLTYEIDTRRISLESAREVVFREQTNEIHAQQLHYQPGPDGRLGQFLALGDGWLSWIIPGKSRTGASGGIRGDHPRPAPPAMAGPDEPPRRFDARWTKQLHARPHEGQQVISLEGQTVSQMSGMGKIAAEEVHVWLREDLVLPETPPAGTTPRPKPQLTPQRMMARGGVDIDSPQLTGRTEKLEAWFVEATPQFGNTTPAVRPGPVAAAASEFKISEHGHRYLVARPPVVDAPLVPRPTYPQGPTPSPSPAPSPRPLYSRPQPGFPAQSPRLANPMGPVPGTQGVPRTATAMAGSRAAVIPPQGPVQPVAYNQPSTPPVSEKRLQRFHVRGDLVRIEMRLVDKQVELSEVVVNGNARLNETQTPEPGERPLLITGDRVHAVQQRPDAAVVTVVGTPGHVEGRGLALDGAAVNMDQAANKVWIDGPGRMTLVVERDMQGEPTAQATPLYVDWQGSMQFDGRQATFERQVVAYREQEKLQTQTLEVILSDQVVFRREARPAQRPEVAQLRCHGGVFMERRVFDPRQQLESFEQMQTHDLTIDQRSGAVFASGPGWIKRLGYTKRSQNAPLATTRGTLAGPSATLPEDEKQLTFLRVEFNRSVTGNFRRRQMIFGDTVQTVYAPVPHWDATVNPDRPDQVGPQGVVLTCERLTVTEMQAGKDKRWFELVAEGNTVVEGQAFTANAERLTYTEDKSLLILEGTPRAAAELWRQERLGGKVSRAAARKIMFWSDTNRIEVDGAEFLDLSQLPRRPAQSGASATPGGSPVPGVPATGQTPRVQPPR